MTEAADYNVVLTCKDFAEWLGDKPKRGERVQYYRGFLAGNRTERLTPNGQWATDHADDQLASMAWLQYMAGNVTLVQRRIGMGDYLYIAEATRG